jgi:mannose-6-phosphate isomerase-like protein (cupin superfamily)
MTRHRTTPAGPAARLIDPAAAETLDVLGPTAQILTPIGDDDGPCLIRGLIPAGGEVPLHSHPDPETFIARSGRAEALVDGPQGRRWVPLAPGDMLHLPGGIRHAWRNTSCVPATSLIVTTGRLGRFFREVGSPDPPESGRPRPPLADRVASFLKVAERHGFWNATPADNAAVGIGVPR